MSNWEVHLGDELTEIQRKEMKKLLKKFKVVVVPNTSYSVKIYFTSYLPSHY